MDLGDRDGVSSSATTAAGRTPILIISAAPREGRSRRSTPAPTTIRRRRTAARSMLRRAPGSRRTATVITFGDYRIDCIAARFAGTVSRSGTELLAMAPDRNLNLLFTADNNEYLRVPIHQSAQPRRIQTEIGVGYRGSMRHPT